MDTPLSGILPYLYSIGDQAKRQIYGMLGDPASFAGSVAQDLQTQQDERRKALTTLLSPGVFTTPQEHAAAQNALTNEAMNLLGITVWHGSPHKFDKFDASKIGTGEGAQSYGHGLYFADRPEVAGSYRKTQDISAYLPPPGQPLDPSVKKALLEADYLGFNTAGEALSAMRDSGNWKKSFDWTGISPESIRVLDEYLKKYPGGNLYKTDLPDSMVAKMLDWDKPLSQQPESVRQALESAPGWPFVKQFIDRDFTRNVPAGVKPNGQALSEILSNRFGGQDKAAEYLQSIGIPGIRYLDAGSRGAGKGSYNYVVFPGGEGLLSILERNGVPLQGLLGK